MAYQLHSRSAILALLAVLAVGPLPAGEAEGPLSTIRSVRQVGQIDRVTVLLEASGDLLERAGPRAEKIERTRIDLTCKREYYEKTLELPGGPTNGRRGVRWYQEAEAAWKERDKPQRRVLAPGHRLIGLDITPPAATRFCPTGALTLDELELVRALGDSLPLDALLPSEPVPVGRKWKTADDLLAVLLDLEQIKTNTVETLLKEATPHLVRLELAGRVEGMREGAADRIELAGKCRFDRATGRIDWFAMKVKEQMDISLVERGLDVEQLVRIRVLPEQACEQLGDDALRDLSLRPTEALCRLLYRPADGGWQMLHDRSWFCVSHARDLDLFRRIDHGQDLGLCKISPLGKVAPEKLISLEEFQAEVRQSLGKNFGQIAEAAQSSNEAGCRVYRVAVTGRNGEVPVRWHYYLVSDELGHRAVFALPIAEDKAEAFGKADEAMIQTFRFDAK
ncbi:MAG: hypothetical protein ABSG86_19320 [Thermoguttaceae bacterium]|jgi:hypothetical protein